MRSGHGLDALRICSNHDTTWRDLIRNAPVPSEHLKTWARTVADCDRCHGRER